MYSLNNSPNIHNNWENSNSQNQESLARASNNQGFPSKNEEISQLAQKSILPSVPYIWNGGSVWNGKRCITCCLSYPNTQHFLKDQLSAISDILLIEKNTHPESRKYSLFGLFSKTDLSFSISEGEDIRVSAMAISQQAKIAIGTWTLDKNAIKHRLHLCNSSGKEIKSKKIIRTYRKTTSGQNSLSRIVSLDFFNNNLVLSCMNNGYICVYNIDTDKINGSFFENIGYWHGACFSADGRQILITALTHFELRDSTNLELNQSACITEQGKYFALVGKLSPDGHYAATLDITNTLHIWDIENQDKSSIRELKFSSTSSKQMEGAFNPGVQLFAFNSDSSKIIISDESSKLYLLDIAEGTIIVLYRLEKEFIHSFQITRDNLLLIIWSYNERKTSHDRHILYLADLMNTCLSQYSLINPCSSQLIPIKTYPSQLNTINPYVSEISLTNSCAPQLNLTNSHLPQLYPASMCSAINKKIPLPNNYKLTVYNTKGDSSCAFHALFGTANNGVITCSLASALRNSFCYWLKNNHEKSFLISDISLIIEDYFLNTKYAPSSFIKNTKNEYDFYSKNYQSLSKAMKRQRLESFCTDPKVRASYIENLADPSTYLLQQEVKFLAQYSGTDIHLYQKEWGTQNNMSYGITIFNARTDGIPTEYPTIFYYENNHYEKALLSSAAENEIN